MNYNAQIKKMELLNGANVWQKLGLVGLTKKIPIKTKYTKGAKLQVLYDFLYHKNSHNTEPVIFRIGYSF